MPCCNGSLSIIPDRIPPHPLQRTSKRLEGQAGEIIVVARKLFEASSISSTSITSIAKEANVSRELIYYYFDNKQALVDAVIDDYVEDMVESAMVWNESRQFGNTPESLRKCIISFKRALFDAQGLRPMIAVLQELGIRDAFVSRAVQETARYLNDCVTSEYAAYHPIKIDLVYETFCVLLFGLVGVVKAFPDITDDALMKIVEQTLHLDMNVITKP